MTAQVTGKAVVISSGYLANDHAKTTHGLIRFSQRFEILAVIDREHAGKDAGEVLDGLHRNIPIYRDITEAKKYHQDIDYAIIGVATAGGVIPKKMKVELKDLLSHGISIVNGLHQFLNDMPDMVALALANGAQLIDIRKPRPRRILKFWSGEIYQVDTPIIAVLGTDCALGKRTTARWLVESGQEAGLNTQMIFTGQTGWLQEGRFGFILDSTVNDFISGEIESCIVECYRQTQPDLIIIEGQSALQNPSGPCGSEIIISGRASKVILQHNPLRKYYEGCEELELEIGPLNKEIQLINLLGAEVVAICLNLAGADRGDSKRIKAEIQAQVGIPVFIPLEEGVSEIINIIRA